MGVMGGGNVGVMGGGVMGGVMCGWSDGWVV